MMPKISVRPAGHQEQQQAVLDGVQALDEEGGESMRLRHPHPRSPGCAGDGAIPGCAAYIRQPRAGSARPLIGDAHQLVLLAVDLAQVDVLHRVVRLADRERAARAVDLGLLDGGGELGLLRDVALHRVQADAQHLRGVVALHGVDVGLQLEGLGVGQRKACRAACSGRRRSAAWSACLAPRPARRACRRSGSRGRTAGWSCSGPRPHSP
jgi:hypothetical protein